MRPRWQRILLAIFVMPFIFAWMWAVFAWEGIKYK